MRRWVCLMVLGFGSMALAQSGTTPIQQADGATAVSPFWRGGNDVERLVSQTVMSVPEARAAAVVARMEYHQAGSELNLATNVIRANFEDSPEYLAALDDLRRAYVDFGIARDRALAPISESVVARAADQLRSKLTVQIHDEWGQRKPDFARILATAALKIEYMAATRIAEAELIAGDAAVVASRARLHAAGRALSRIEADFRRDVRDDLNLVTLRQERQRTRIKMLAAAAYRDAMNDARDVALSYAVWSRGIDRYSPAPYYDYRTRYVSTPWRTGYTGWKY
jgi:hypothetical protein